MAQFTFFRFTELISHVLLYLLCVNCAFRFVTDFVIAASCARLDQLLGFANNSALRITHYALKVLFRKAYRYRSADIFFAFKLYIRTVEDSTVLYYRKSKARAAECF